MTRKSHRNSKRRLTARERARQYLTEWGTPFDGGADQERAIVRMLAAHARAALSRERARRGRGSR